MAGTSGKAKHHHGDLRRALIKAGIDILHDEGLSGLTLRKCASRAGVSHAAPAHHFDGVDGLRAGIAREAFALLHRYMLDEANQGEKSDRGRLHAVCKGYVTFARAEPALYDLLFSMHAPWRLIAGGDGDGASAYQVLADACAPFVAKGMDPAILETQAWSLVHGYAMLCLRGRFGDETPPDEQVLSLLNCVGGPPAP